MPRPMSDHPTDLELEILKILWEESPLNARDVQTRLAEAGRELAYSSVITMCNIMVDKGQLAREKQARAFVFTPVREREDVAAGMTGDLLTRLFDGSAAQMMLGLFDAADIDADELTELRKMLNRKAKSLREDANSPERAHATRGKRGAE